MNPQNNLKTLALLAFALPLAGMLVVCSPSKGVSKSGPTLTSLADVSATAELPRDADLLLAGSPLPVTIQSERKGDEFVIKMIAFNEEVETEIYRIGSVEFSLVEAAGERYDPPLPILKFPMQVGDEWTWNGNLMLSTEAHKTEAKITSSRDWLNVEGFDDEAIKIRVELSIESGGPEPAKRVLSFWFVPGKGMLKREFGQASSRIPAQREHPDGVEKLN